MKLDYLHGPPPRAWRWRGIATGSLLALLVAGSIAFRSDWNHNAGEGSLEHAHRLMQQSENEKRGCQGFETAGSQAWETLRIMLLYEHDTGWQGDQARAYLEQYRKALK